MDRRSKGGGVVKTHSSVHRREQNDTNLDRQYRYARVQLLDELRRQLAARLPIGGDGGKVGAGRENGKCEQIIAADDRQVSFQDRWAKDIDTRRGVVNVRRWATTTCSIRRRPLSCRRRNRHRSRTRPECGLRHRTNPTVVNKSCFH